ncbi:MAG: hypothetical protein IT340_17735 [Chloroflexi bacterium]|nr:hypothetical protein [Chloroflexota bacterium]
MDIVLQLAQAVLVVVILIAVIVVMPFLFLIVFSFAYGPPTGPRSTRQATTPPAPGSDEEGPLP